MIVFFIVVLSFILYIGDVGLFCGVFLLVFKFVLIDGGILIGIGVWLGIGIVGDIIDKGCRGGGSDIFLYVIGCKGGGIGSVVMGMGCICIMGVFVVICVIFFGRCGILGCNLFIFGGIDIMIGIWFMFEICIGCCWCAMLLIGIIWGCVVIW